jgi:hypothetical protein
MKGALTRTWTPTIGRQLLLWAIAAAGAAVLVAALAIAIILATGSSSAKPAVTQRPAQLAGHTNTTCAPDDTRPIGPGDQGVPACLTQ